MTGSGTSGVTGITIPTTLGNVFYLVAASNDCGLGPKH
jgi:hypothetical protein